METGNFFRELDSIFQTKNISDAEKFVISSMERVIEENDLPSLLVVANELGGIYRVTNRFGEAKKIYGVAAELIRLLGLENTVQHGTTLLNLGSVHTEAKEASEALKLYEKAELIFRNAGLDQDYQMAALYNNMSHACDKLEKPMEAMGYAEKALAVIRKLKGHETELATSCTTLAARCAKVQKQEEALQYLSEAEGIFRKLPGKPNPHYAATLNSLGELFYRRGNQEEAVGYFEKALEVIRENYGENQSFAEVSKNLAKAKDAAASHGKRMKGLALSEAYFNEHGRKMIEEGFPEYKRYMAIGLVGEGSECFGFDDELSESHDFGPGFCIWLPDEIYQSIGRKMKEAYERLPKEFRGKRRIETFEGGGRTGVFSIQEFYKKYIGCSGIPTNHVEWLFAPETSLSTVTNGTVFEDHGGEFTRIRNGLLDFYPEDVRLKKLAARMAMLSQTGQYNYERCMKRNEYAAAYLACGEFIRTAVSTVYLLNRRYMPFYKWMFRGMEELLRLRDVKPMLEQLASMPDIHENTKNKVSIMEGICVKIRDELETQGIVKGPDPFLNSHCRDVMSLISDPRIRNLPVMFDGR